MQQIFANMRRYQILGAILLFYANYCIIPIYTDEIYTLIDENHTEPANRPDDFLVYYQGVEGIPGEDFPIYSNIPRTSFSCKGIDSGYYADLDTDCQVFHICEEERKISFLCPNGTIFQQSDLICEWWFKVNCTDAPNLYAESAELLQEDLARRKLLRRVHLDGNERNHGAVLRAEEIKTVTIHQNGKGTNLNPGIINAPNRVAHEDRKLSISQDNGQNKFESRSYSDETKPRGNAAKQSSRRTSIVANLNSRSQPHNLKEYHIQFASTNSGSNNDNTAPTTALPEYGFGRNNYPSDKQTSLTDSINRKPSSRGHVRYNSPNENDRSAKGQTHNQLITDTAKSTFAHETNDRTKQKIEFSDSEESQITQESSSFIKSSFNSIQDSSKKYFTPNPYPNHRSTYSDLKQPSQVAIKQHSSISSVTPQYITTQPINNGKPFLGSRVGADIHTTVGTISVEKDQSHQEDEKIFQVTPNSITLSTSSSNLEVTTTSKPFDFSTNNHVTEEIKTFDNGDIITTYSSTIQPYISTYYAKDNVNKYQNTVEYFSPSSRKTNAASSTQSTPLSEESVTARTDNQATVYGFFSEKPTEASSSNLKIPGTGQAQKSTVASVSNGYPSLSNGVQIKFDKNASKIGLSLGKYLSEPTSHSTKQSSVSHPPLVRDSYRSSTISPKPFQSLNDKTVSPNSNNLQNNLRSNIINVSQPNNGFFVTKNSLYDSSQNYNQATPIVNIGSNAFSGVEITSIKPRPFQKNINLTPNVLSSTEKTISVTYPNYKISSASPFKVNNNGKQYWANPTLPTPFSSNPSIYQNVDNMINKLMQMATEDEQDFSSETPRPGLIVPPSVGPQTLHTLAVYFANTLGGMVKDRNMSDEETKQMKEDLTTLLTQMTVHGYNQLFHQSDTHSDDALATSVTDEGVNGLQTDASKNLIQSPEIRMLARNFSLALASYLNDPEMFKKDLEDLRPTEPSDFEIIKDNDETGTDEELLNFSDADTKSSSLPQPSPTWGFILATDSNDVDNRNSLSPDLNTADSQSFIPKYNNINAVNNLPLDHWTTSPSATKLWSTTFGVNPASVNDHFITTAATPSAEAAINSFSAPEKIQDFEPPHTELRYELRSLPKLSLNSTQIHGILIDFMNTTNDDSSRLHRLLKKLNTSEEEFLSKMREIESNPLTKRLILLLISECGVKAAKDIDELSLSSSENSKFQDNQEKYNNNSKEKSRSNSAVPELVKPSLSEDDQDVRALQLLNSLYSIASKFGK